MKLYINRLVHSVWIKVLISKGALKQDLIQLQGLTRQFVFKSFRRGQRRTTGDNVLITVIAKNSKCNIILKFRQTLPLQKGFSFCPSDKILVFIKPCDMENHFEIHLTYIHCYTCIASSENKKKVENDI